MPSSRSTDTFGEFILKQMSAWGGAMALPDADMGLISSTMSSLRDYMTKPTQAMDASGMTNAPQPPAGDPSMGGGMPGGAPGGMPGQGLPPGPPPAAPGMGMGASIPVPAPDASQNPGMSSAVAQLLSQGVQGGGSR